LKSAETVDYKVAPEALAAAPRKRGGTLRFVETTCAFVRLNQIARIIRSVKSFRLD
jgi:hypothetical protein